MEKAISRALGALICTLFPRVDYADLVNLNNALKFIYAPVIVEMQNTEPFTWREFEEQEDKQADIGGKGYVYDAREGGNQEGIGARPETGALPVAGRQRHVNGLIVPKYVYGTYQLTGQAIEHSKENVQAFVNIKADEMETLIRDIIKDLNRQIWNDGSGVMATANGTDGATFFDVTDGMYLRKNMKIDVWIGNAKVVNMVNRRITNLTINADGTWRVEVNDGGTAPTGLVTPGDVVIRADAATAAVPRIGHEVTGFKAMIDDGTVANIYMGINRTTSPLHKGNVLGNAGVLRNISLDLHQQAEDAIVEMCGSRPDWMRMNMGQRRQFFSLVAPDRRFDSGTFDAGFERLSYNGTQVTIDIDHPKGEITYLKKEYAKKYTLRPLGFLNQDGQTMRQVPGFDVWVGHVGTYVEIASMKPNSAARITDLQEPTTIQRVRG